MAKYRIVFDPNDQHKDVNGQLYRQYHIQRKTWFGWRDLTHDFVGSGMAINWDPKERFQSRYRSREACLERIRHEEASESRQPLVCEEVEV
jgi:hypothetical protein